MRFQNVILDSDVKECKIREWECCMYCFALLLFYTIAIVFQLYLCDDMRRRKHEPTLLLTPGIFHLPHHICRV